MAPTRSQTIGLVTGIVLAIGLQFMPVPEPLTREAWLLASLALLMAAANLDRDAAQTCLEQHSQQLRAALESCNCQLAVP